MVKIFSHMLIFFFFCSVIKKEKQPPSPDDVIVLSDNEPSSPLMNGHCFTKTDTDKLMVGTQSYNIYRSFFDSVMADRNGQSKFAKSPFLDCM